MAIFLGPIHANPVRYLSNESPSNSEPIEQNPNNFQNDPSQSIKDFNLESWEKDKIASSMFEAIAQKATGLWELKQHLSVFGSEALAFTPELPKLKEFFKRSGDDEDDDNDDENEDGDDENDNGNENEKNDEDEDESDDGDENDNDDDGDDDGEDDDNDNENEDDDNEDEDDDDDNEQDGDTASNYEKGKKGNENPKANPNDWTCKGCDEWTSHADDCDENSPNYSECVKHGLTVISTTTKTVNMIKPTTYTVTKPGTVSTVYSTLIKPTTVSLTTTRYRTRRIHNTVTFTPSSIHTSFSPYNIVENPSSIIPESSSQPISDSVSSFSSDTSTTSSSFKVLDTSTISSSSHSTHSRHHRMKTITKFDTTAISTMWDTVTVTTATTTTMTPISSNSPSISSFVGINFSSFNATVSSVSSLDSSSKVDYGFGNGMNQTDKTASSVTTSTPFSANSFSTKVSSGSTDVRVDNPSTQGLFNQTYSAPLATDSASSLTFYHENFNHTIGSSSIAQTEEQSTHDKPMESTTSLSDVTTTVPAILGDQFTSFPMNRTEQTDSVGSLLNSDIPPAFFNHTIQTASLETFSRVDPMTTSFPFNSVETGSLTPYQVFNQTVVTSAETSKISFPLLNQTGPNLFAKPGFNHTIATSTLEDTSQDTLTPSVLPLDFTHTLVDSSESTSLATQTNLAFSNQGFPLNQTISIMASPSSSLLDNGSSAPVHSNIPLFNHTAPNFNGTILTSSASSTVIASSINTFSSEISSIAGKDPYYAPMNQTVQTSGSGMPLSSSGLLFNHTVPSVGFFNISHFNETGNTSLGFNRTIITSALSRGSESVDTIYSALHSGEPDATSLPVFSTSTPGTGKRINQTIDTVYSDLPAPANLTADHRIIHSDVSHEPLHIFPTPPMFNVTYGTRPKPMNNPLDSVPASVGSSFTTDIVSEATSSEISSFVPMTSDLDTVSSASPGTVSHSHSRRTIYIDITVTTTLSTTTLHGA